VTRVGCGHVPPPTPPHPTPPHPTPPHPTPPHPTPPHPTPPHPVPSLVSMSSLPYCTWSRYVTLRLHVVGGPVSDPDGPLGPPLSSARTGTIRGGGVDPVWGPDSLWDSRLYFEAPAGASLVLDVCVYDEDVGALHETRNATVVLRVSFGWAGGWARGPACAPFRLRFCCLPPPSHTHTAHTHTHLPS
jgi:hypothetical protein